MDKLLWIPLITAFITLGFNVTFHLLKNEFDWFVDKKKFKREHGYKQLTELYLELYGIIVQSEYLRYFYGKADGKEISIYEVPFFELEIKSTKTKTIINSEKGLRTETHTEMIENGITEFNKRLIDEKIIDRAKYASSDLLKLAIAHRYTEKYYKENITDEKISQQFKDEELLQISKIVRLIIKETNELLELCHMNFDGKEISYGVMNTEIYEKKNHI